MWWMLVPLVLCLIVNALADFATWPGCRQTTHWGERLRVLQPTTIDLQADDLHLEHCRLTRLNARSFVNSPNVRMIHLDHNQIQHIETDAFEGTLRLEEAVLSNNAFFGKNLPPNLFRNSNKLVSLRFSSNNMKDTPSDLLMGLNLNMIDLISCSLEEVPSFITSHSLPEMVNIDMSSNKIRALHQPNTFSSVPNLETLNLRNNQIGYLHENLLRPLNQITLINLNQNKITRLPEKFFEGKSSLETINLSDNLIEYIPANAFKDTVSLWDLNLGGNKLTFLPNEFFAVLQGKMDIFSFDRNPWQCACLNEILIKVKKKNIQYDGSTFNGEKQVCTLNNFRCLKI